MAVNVPTKRLGSGRWAMQLAAFALILILVAIVLHRLFDLATPVALNLLYLAFAGAALAIVLAAFALWRVWQTGYRGSGSALVGLVIAGAIWMWPVSLLPTFQALPTLNDVSTDLEDPPAFIEAAKRRSPASNPLAYPGPAFAEQQRAAYPDLQSLVVERTISETVALVASALRRQHMEVVRVVPPEGRGGAGYVEAVDRTLVFGFRDDVVVRVKPWGRGALVDVRSASRYGRHDLGRNAMRVREVMAKIVERIQATVPKKRR